MQSRDAALEKRRDFLGRTKQCNIPQSGHLCFDCSLPDYSLLETIYVSVVLPSAKPDQSPLSTAPVTAESQCKQMGNGISKSKLRVLKQRLEYDLITAVQRKLRDQNQQDERRLTSGDVRTLTFKNLASYIQDERTATLQMLHFIYIFSANISTENFKHAAHFPFFTSKCRLFHNATFFGSCIIHILHTGCAKI